MPPVGPRLKLSPSTPFMVHVFLSNNDQYNWQTQNPLFSQISQAFISPHKTIFYIYHATWNDCQQLLATLFMPRSETGSDLRVGQVDNSLMTIQSDFSLCLMLLGFLTCPASEVLKSQLSPGRAARESDLLINNPPKVLNRPLSFPPP